MSRVKYLLDGSVYAVGSDSPKVLSRADESKYNSRPSAGVLPSFGQEYEVCGDDRINFCSECGETHVVGRCCERAQCPRDWAKWDVSRSTKAVAKMEETREEIAMERGQSPKFHHVVLSMEGIQFASENPTESMFELAKRILTSHLRVDGGYMLYHPYRGDDDDRGEWKRRIGQGTQWSEVSDDLNHEEHIHALVVADTVDYMTCEAVYEETGVLVHRITQDDSNVSLYGLQDLAKATTYSLSHANLNVSDDGSSRVSARYFGRVAQTSAGFQTEARANARVREVAGTTLGVSFSDLSCTRELDDDEEKCSHSCGSGGSSSEPSEPAESEGDERVCGGRLLDITKAPKFLNDEDWCEKADYVDELRESWMSWKDPPD